MKRKLTLNNPIDRGDGLQQSKVEIDYIYVHDDYLAVHTKQGNVVHLEMTSLREKIVEKIEDDIKEKLETL